jgi:hypothetical protein
VIGLELLEPWVGKRQLDIRCHRRGDQTGENRSDGTRHQRGMSTHHESSGRGL